MEHDVGTPVIAGNATATRRCRHTNSLASQTNKTGMTTTEVPENRWDLRAGECPVR